MTKYERTMLVMAAIRTVGVVFVVMCWIFTIWRAFLTNSLL
jgi:hypothetical protein